MRFRRLAPALLVAALIAPLAACSAGQSTVAQPDIGLAMPTSEQQLDDASGVGEIAQNEFGPEPVERSIVRSGDISIRVNDPAEAAEEVTAVVQGLDGFVEAERIDRGDESASGSAYLQVRVPVERLDEAFSMLGEVGTVLSQSRAADDVTTLHVDLQARVGALESSITRLTELMGGSATTGELIEAESALSQRQQELDGLRAQLAALEGQVAQASISVSLTTESAIPGGPDNFWEGLVFGWQSVVTAGSVALVLLGALLPWLLLGGAIALGVVLVVRWRRRAKKKRSV